ncbi:MAG TPA: hypothetical protein VL486_00685 [Verrucomicrobiae bacterium]|nr:hypothetical protein [Verrucomicrobiae bacterium]
MSRHALFVGTSLLVGALVTSVLQPVCAAKPPPAQLGTLQIGGSPTSGGTLTYQLNLTVTSPGVLVTKGRLTGKKLRVLFPALTNSVVAGVMSVTSDSVAIPTNFLGTAVLRVKAKLGRRNIGQKSVLITISAAAAPTTPQTTLYDVGFNTNVAVNADAVSTNGFTPPLTYAWSLTDTDVRTNATFSSTTTNAPTFNTLPLTSFTNLLDVTSGGVTNVLDPVDLENSYDLATNSNLVHFTSEQVTATTYHLQVIVSDAAHAATGTVTVISTSVSPGQPSIPLGERQYLTGAPNGTNASTYSWSITAKPTGSTAVLVGSKTRTPSLEPDAEGDYVLQLTVSGGGKTNSSFVTVRGATYVGVATCASCHGTSPLVGLEDYYTPWSQTLHATMAQRGIDGLLGSSYNASCLACHTVGYNQSPSATNGNFYAVQQEVGWTFPTVLQYGNYAAMPAALQNKANIQCESCHGPGSQHPGAESANLDVAVCATCHQDGHFHNRPKQWRLGPHGADDEYLSVSIGEAPNPSCAKCHSPTSFVDYLKGKALTRLEAGRLTCQACHDPHNVAMFPADAHQVRVYDTVTLDSIDTSTGTNAVLTGQGASALCMQCHNARANPYQVSSGKPYYMSSLPHESTATDILLGFDTVTNVVATVVTGGVTNLVPVASVTLENSAHSGVAKCIDCHMYNAGVNTVGDHTFSMSDRLTGEDDIAACNQCHAGVDPVTEAEGFDHVSIVRSGFPGAADYNGDGTVSGVQTEVDGLLANLEDKMTNCVDSSTATNSLKHSAGYPFWSGYSTNTVVATAQHAAVWNYQMIARELSHGVHNTAYTVRLLQWTYTMLSTNTFDRRTTTVGNPYGGVTGDFPSADLR